MAGTTIFPLLSLDWLLKVAMVEVLLAVYMLLPPLLPLPLLLAVGVKLDRVEKERQVLLPPPLLPPLP